MQGLIASAILLSLFPQSTFGNEPNCDSPTACPVVGVAVEGGDVLTGIVSEYCDCTVRNSMVRDDAIPPLVVQMTCGVCGEVDCKPDEAGNPQKCLESVLWSLALTELQTLAYDQSVGARVRAALAKLGKAPIAESSAKEVPTNPLLVALFMGCALAVIGLVAFILKQR